MRVIGIDTSLRSTGIGVIDAAGSSLVPVYYGTIKNPAARPLSACLAFLGSELDKLLAQYQPHAAAIEGIFYAKNVKTMLILAHARGVVISRCAAACLPVYEYEPRRVKMAVTGWGAAEKPQMQEMVRKLLNLPELPQNDAADALAMAITHLHSQTQLALLAAKPI